MFNPFQVSQTIFAEGAASPLIVRLILLTDLTGLVGIGPMLDGATTVELSVVLTLGSAVLSSKMPWVCLAIVRVLIGAP